MYELIWSSLYRVAIFLVRIPPRCVALRCGEIFALFYYLLARKDRSILRENLRIILGEKYRERFVVNTYKNFAHYLVDFMRIKEDNHWFFQKYFRIENREVIDKALNSSPGGVAALSMHLGNWELGGGYLAFLNYKISAIALDHSVHYIDRFFKLQRKRLGIDAVPFRNSFNISLSRLKEKRLLALLCDRDFTGKFIKKEFFNRCCYLCKGPFLLGLRAQVPLIFGVTVREGYGYRVIIQGPFKYEYYLLEEIDSLASKILALMEKFIKTYPDQWFFFQRFWESPKEFVIV